MLMRRVFDLFKFWFAQLRAHTLGCPRLPAADSTHKDAPHPAGSQYVVEEIDEICSFLDIAWCASMTETYASGIAAVVM